MARRNFGIVDQRMWKRQRMKQEDVSTKIGHRVKLVRTINNNNSSSKSFDSNLFTPLTDKEEENALNEAELMQNAVKTWGDRVEEAEKGYISESTTGMVKESCSGVYLDQGKESGE
ncbi:hypothetical protein HAX54_012844 [Datura stramonium]|uniref:Uncharacterized protein n=1 Tax=Datura stramonium TaxID=4076 RepID=A0ABS8TM15_DATST|nr:hypothetical protein [Datura stramonium]